MNLTNIKAKNQGFTIVELLIVVVVIAILAAITIVSYNGITNRANASSAKSTASSLQKKVELYAADEGKYPFTTGALTGAASDKAYATPTSVFPGGVNSGALNATNGKDSVKMYVCTASGTPTAANTTGVEISYWDYEATTPGETASAKRLKAGTGSSCALAGA